MHDFATRGNGYQKSRSYLLSFGNYLNICFFIQNSGISRIAYRDYDFLNQNWTFTFLMLILMLSETIAGLTASR